MTQRKPAYPPVEYLKRRLTLEQLLEEQRREGIELGLPPNPKWLIRFEEFTRNLKPGDEIWYWEHLPGPLTGGAGFCIVRAGASVAHIVTMRS